jgi:hypothetical protein
MFGGILLLVSFGLCVWKTRDPEPVVCAVIQVVHEKQILFAPGSDRADFSSFARSLPALCKMRAVLNTALRDKKVSTLALVRAEADPIEWLERSLQVEYGAPQLLTVALLQGDPQERVVLVNAVCHAFVNEMHYKKNQACNSGSTSSRNFSACTAMS